MTGSALYSKACRVLSMTAVLMAAVGLHVIHPAFHACCTDDGPANPSPCQRGARAPHPSGSAVLGPGGQAALTLPPECPICVFLAAFHSRTPAPAPQGPAADVTAVTVVSPELPAVPTFAWLPFGARGPPRRFLPLV